MTTGSVGARTTPGGSRYGLAALGVIAVTVVWRSFYLSGSYFNQDDYVAMGWAHKYGLTWDYLFIDYAGHVNPGQRLLYSLMVTMGPMEWGAAAAIILVLQTLAPLLMWRVLVRIGSPRAALAGLVLFCWSPMTLMPTLWFGAALALWPQIIFALVAVLFLLRARQRARGGAWNLVGTVLAYAVGLTFHERSLLTLPLLLGTAVLLSDEPRPVARVLRELRRLLPLWLTLTGITGLFLVAYTRLAADGGGLNPDPWENAKLVLWYVFRAVLPGTASGPWSGSMHGSAVTPPVWSSVLATVLVVGLVVTGIRFGGRATRWALVVFAGYVAADVAMLLVGRGGFGPVIALDPRYSADIVVVAAIALVAASRDEEWQSWWEGLAGLGAPYLTGLLAAYLAGALATTVLLAPQGQNREDRRYVESIRTALHENPTVVLYDEQVPPEILLGAFGPYSQLSQVLSTLPENPRFDAPSEQLRQVRPSGAVVPVTFEDPAFGVPGPVDGCGYAVKDRVARVPLSRDVTGKVVARVDYFTDLDTVMTLRVGDRSVALPVSPGAHRIEAVLDLTGQPAQDKAELQLEEGTGSAVCVGSLLIGPPSSESP